ncbi:hypothetical protein HDV03_000956 [Kappamyces sp. JEL0829]|nr:hypothetical protein HDV03_000956 [Kappamyces sp. JEL0829]
MPSPQPTGPRLLIVDNYDSYTFNLFQYFTASRGLEPVVIRNDQFTCRQVVKANPPMHGRTTPVLHDGKGIFKGIPSPFDAVRYHSLVVSPTSLPDELVMNAWSSDPQGLDPIIMGLMHKSRPVWSVQFHPESICTQYGQQIVNNFYEMVEQQWSLNPAHKSDVPLPPSLQHISVLPSPLVPPQARRSREYHAFVKPLDFIVDSEAAFSKLYSTHPNTFWLDSARVEKGLSRYSFMGDSLGPDGYSLDSRLVTVHGHGESLGEHSLGSKQTFFEYLSQIMHDSQCQSVESINQLPLPAELPPFLGGLVGVFGYEMKSETLSCSSAQKTFSTSSAGAVPDSSFLFTDRTIVFDHQCSKIYLVTLVDFAKHHSGIRKIQNAWMDETTAALEKLAGCASSSSGTREAAVKRINQLKLSHDKLEYVDMIEQSLAKIRDGETYEVCLTTQLTARIARPHPHPLEMYKHLRSRNPAPYAAYMSFGENLIVSSSSPERFLRIEGKGVITMKPIKGTVKVANRTNFKGTDEEIAKENAVRRRELAESEKNRSENLMIVDLIRNDLNQISLPNSVHVPALMAVESYATVHQLVTTVASTLRPELTAVDAIMRSFPPGSMTGAPKLRTVQLIESLEKIPRGPYSGVLGFFSVCGQADFSVVIRTAVFDQQQGFTNVSVGAGGAIVILSDPVEEFDEMVLKSHTVLPSLHAVYKDHFV